MLGLEARYGTIRELVKAYGYSLYDVDKDCEIYRDARGFQVVIEAGKSGFRVDLYDTSSLTNLGGYDCGDIHVFLKWLDKHLSVLASDEVGLY